MYAGRLGRGSALFAAGILTVIVVFATRLMHTFPGMVAGGCLLGAISLFMVFDCARICATAPFVAKPYNKWYGYALAVFLGFGVSTILEHSNYLWSKSLRSFNMPSESMANTLLLGERFYADMAFYCHREPRAGDLVVMSMPQDENLKYIKRVAAVPGDEVEIEGNTLRVNGQTTDMFSRAPAVAHVGPETEKSVRRVLAPGEYFVLGDNPLYSQDSRFFGPVPRRDILGRPLFIYYSTDFGRIGLELS